VAGAVVPGAVAVGFTVAAADAVGDGAAGVLAGDCGGSCGVVGAVAALVALAALAADEVGGLDVVAPCGVQAVAARARPSTAPPANFLEK